MCCVVARRGARAGLVVRMARSRAAWKVVAALAALAAVRYWFRQRRQRQATLRRSRAVVQCGLTARGLALSDARLAAVRAALEQHFAEGREVGAQLCCYTRGVKVVELYGGRSRDEVLGPERLAVVFSCTKVVGSLIVAQLVARGLLAYDAPVAKYWPEFGERVSPAVTVAQLAGHKGGVSACAAFGEFSTAQGVALVNDGAALGALLSSNPPEWVPSQPPSRLAYHAMTHGLYIGELLRRVDGRSADRFVQEEIVAKANEVQAARGEAPVELRIGCAPEQQARVARHELVQPALFLALRLAAHALLPRRLLPLLFDELDLLPRFDLEGVVALALPQTRRAFALFCDSPASPAAIANDPVARSACNLSAFGVTNARALAAVLAAALDGETLLPRAALREALAPAGPRLKCDVLCDWFTFSNAGWGLDRFEQFGLAGWVGWAGMGGSMLVMHPDSQSVFAYTVTGLDSQQHKARAVHLLQLFQRYALDPPPTNATLPAERT